ncbi:ABC transporter ATP-binding protein [Treponema sp. UBA6852]|uniref:ABC transporter ATP-binding protein n=1 Tax=Treponema sp. UBA6852 TaxID=1947744 RepID=UPI0025EF4434|nr:ABC transporter ATP-binding protein [Treponema sp. UBA6852]
MALNEKLKHKYALSDYGVRGMVRAFLAVTLANLVLMLPVGLLYALVRNLLSGSLSASALPFFACGIAFVCALIVLTTVFQYRSTFLTTYVESGIRRRTLAEKLRKLPLSFFGKKDLADLTSTIMGDCAVLETASSHWIPELIGSLISTTLVVLSLFFFNWKMTLAAVWVMPVAFVIVVSSKKVMAKINQKGMKYKLACADGIQEGLETLRDLKSYNAAENYLEGFDKKVRDIEKHSVVAEFSNAAFVVSAQMVLKLGIGTVAVTGAFLLASGEIDILTFFMYLLVVSRMYDPLQVSLQNLAAIISCDVRCERMDEILSHSEQSGKTKLSNKGYDIVFENAGFSYNGGKEILKDVSFTAKQGEVTALIGPSGSGKTTVSRLAARFWDLNRGKISVGGMDISKTDPETLLGMYSIVFQDVTLFNNTVMENIRIGRKDASDDEVIAAAHLARCDDFVEKLPEKWNTVIGENGSELSGGERQRLSIARAFLKNAPIILLDEATASLDVDNETLVQESLSRLIKNKTVLIIAHRMRTVASADKIVVLKNGVVAEQGSPSELLEKGGVYSKMISTQLKASEWKYE